MTPTSKTLSIANKIKPANDEFIYCSRLRCWMFESKCKKKHDRVVKLWKKGNKHPEIDISCLMCDKYESPIKEVEILKYDRRKHREVFNIKGKGKTKFVNIDGVVRSVYEWSKIYGIRAGTVSQRVNEYGLSWEEAITKPVRKYKLKGG